MRQVLLRGGRVELAEVPAPAQSPRRALVATAYSVISAGTERAALRQGSRTVLDRASHHPAPIRRLVEVIREEGPAGILRRLSGPPPGDYLELGYAASGVIVQRGDEVPFPVGTRVACAGAQFAHHAELISVPANLLAAVPDPVPLEEAAFATVGAIAMHSLRRSEAKLSETVGVIGLGLVGLIGAQLARSAGCEVLAFDPDPRRVDLARSLGLDRARVLTETDPIADTLHATGGRGVDAALVFAASGGSEPLTLALNLARKKGKVVVVGDVGMQVDRPLLYAKEIDLLISTSYGPGRYDPDYEEEGRDYPFPYVRWTEGRNLAAFLRLLEERRVRVDGLIDRIWPLEQAGEAYASLDQPAARPGVLLSYPGGPPPAVSARTITRAAAPPVRGEIGAAVVGPGSFMKEIFLPLLVRERSVRLRAVVAGTGGSAASAAARFGAETTSTDLEEVLARPEITLVVIGTRHHLHARQAEAALRAGKAVFVEKPLCLTREELDRIRIARRDAPRPLAVGFNRRYAPLIREMKRRLADLAGPKVIEIRVNAGRVAADHWTQDPRVGGGRLRGEGCHFVDLIPFLAGERIVSLQAERSGPAAESLPAPDNFHLLIRMSGGSTGSLVYTSLGDASLAKERVEVHAGGSSLVLDDFRELAVHRGGRIRRIGGRKDKGIAAEIAALIAALEGEPGDLISWEEIEAATEWTLTAQERLER